MKTLLIPEKILCRESLAGFGGVFQIYGCPLIAFLDEYYASHVATAAVQRNALLASGFIGCAEGPADLSERYKDQLSTSLGSKHDNR